MSQVIFHFRNLRLDPATRQLWRDGERVVLPPKSFDCLTYLLTHRDRAVGRDELIAAVWGRIDVSDKLLSQTLLRARRAIGDGSAERMAIRTLPRFGYHWDEAVEVEAVAEAPPAASPADAGPVVIVPASSAALAADDAGADVPPAPAGVRRPRRGWLLAAVAACLVALAAWAIVRHRPPPPGAPAPAPGENLVLVLPVAGAATGEDSWIRLGAMDYLASRLRKVRGLQVVPSEQTVTLLRQDSGTDQRGEGDLHRFEQMTGAAYILAPRLEHAPGGWNAVLDVYHDRGTQSLEAQAATPLQAMAQIANRFAERIGLSAAAALEPPSSPIEYLQRIDAALLAADLAQARALAEAAPPDSAVDPAFALRRARIAFRSGEVDQAERQLGTLAADSASVPAEIRAQAAQGLGAVALYRQDFGAAERHYTDAIALFGSQGPQAALGKAYMERGVVRGVSKRFDEAMSDFGHARIELERAGDRLGGASLDTNLGLVEVFGGRLTEALSAYDRAIAVYARFGVNDNLAIALDGKIYVQRMLLDLDGALASSDRQAGLKEHLRNPPLVRRLTLSRVQILLDRGRLQEASELIARYLPEPRRASEDPAYTVLRAQLDVERGHPAQALETADAVLDAIEQQPNPGTEVYFSDAIATYVDAALRSGRADAAERFLQRLRNSRPVTQDGGRDLVLELGTARVQASRQDAQAAAHFAKALALADGGNPRDVVNVGAAYADYLGLHADAAHAASILGRLVPYAGRSYDAAHAVMRLYAMTGNAELADRAQADVRRLAGERPS